MQATGEPDVWPSYGDDVGAWAPLPRMSDVEILEVQTPTNQ